MLGSHIVSHSLDDQTNIQIDAESRGVGQLLAGMLVASVIHTWDVPFLQQATFLQNLRDQCAAVGDKFPVMQVTSAEVETLSYSNPAFARCCLADLNAQAGENGT